MCWRAGADWAGASKTNPSVLSACICGRVWRPLQWTRIFLCKATSAVLQECCPCLGKLSVEEGQTRGDTGGCHKTRSKGGSLYRASCACCQAFLGGIREKSSGENKGNTPQWKGKRCVICIPKLVTVGSSASTVRKCPAQGGKAEGVKEDSCKQQPVVQVPSLAWEGITATLVIQINSCHSICYLYRLMSNAA